MDWVIQELAGADLGDSRLDVRLIKIVEQFSQCQEASLPEACGSKAATRGAYRFLENQRVEHPARYLDQALEQTSVRGKVQVELPRRGNRPPRKAVLAIRWVTVRVHAPRRGPKREPVEMTFILAEEIDPPRDEPRIRWVLATTLTVRDLEDAVRYLQWYAYRWTIEHFHYVLKSGCRIEQLQLESVEGMERAIATYTVVAWRTLCLTREARETPDTPLQEACRTQAVYLLHRRQPVFVWDRHLSAEEREARLSWWAGSVLQRSGSAV